MSAPLTQMEKFARVRLRPRTRIAAALMGAGMGPDEASQATGLHKNYLSVLSRVNPEFRAEVESTTEAILEKVQDPREALQKLLLPAIKKTARLMEHAQSEDTQLKAASSLLDRGGMARETKMQTQNLTLTGQDVEALAKALVESAQIKEDLKHHAAGYEAVEAKVERTLPTTDAVMGVARLSEGSDSRSAGERNK